MAERDITARVRKIVGNDGKYFRRRGSSATGVKENDPQLKAEKRRKRYIPPFLDNSDRKSGPQPSLREDCGLSCVFKGRNPTRSGTISAAVTAAPKVTCDVHHRIVSAAWLAIKRVATEEAKKWN